MVAMTILALLASGVFGAFVFSRRTMTASSARLLALSYAEQVAEELRTEIGSNSLNVAHPARNLPSGHLMSSLTTPTRTYTIRNGKFLRTDPPGPQKPGDIIWEPAVDDTGVPVSDTNYDFKEVRVNVNWTQPTSS